MAKKCRTRWTNQQIQQKIDRIFEAYATLSIDKLRAENEVPTIRNLDSSNYVPVDGIKDPEYREMVFADRKRRMKDFSFNKIYKYNGGHPNKHSNNRGNALGAPGEFHSAHEEFIATGEDMETDFKVTRFDVEMYTESLRAPKDMFRPKSFFRSKVIESFEFKKHFSMLFYYAYFLVGLFAANIAVRQYMKYRRAVQEKKLSAGVYKMTEDGVVYVDN